MDKLDRLVSHQISEVVVSVRVSMFLLLSLIGDGVIVILTREERGRREGGEREERGRRGGGEKK